MYASPANSASSWKAMPELELPDSPDRVDEMAPAARIAAANAAVPSAASASRTRAEPTRRRASSAR
jgi:hypothetical protein